MIAATNSKLCWRGKRAAFTASRPEPLSQRKDRIRRAIALVKDHGEETSPRR